MIYKHALFLVARRTFEKMSGSNSRYLDLWMGKQWAISVQVWLMELVSPVTLHHFIVLLRTAFSSWHKWMHLSGKVIEAIFADRSIQFGLKVWKLNCLLNSLLAT